MHSWALQVRQPLGDTFNTNTNQPSIEDLMATVNEVMDRMCEAAHVVSEDSLNLGKVHSLKLGRYKTPVVVDTWIDVFNRHTLKAVGVEWMVSSASLGVRHSPNYRQVEAHLVIAELVEESIEPLLLEECFAQIDKTRSALIAAMNTCRPIG
jgi:hypothetical protein